MKNAYKKIRKVWAIRPVTKVKPNKKKDVRMAKKELIKMLNGEDI